MVAKIKKFLESDAKYYLLAFTPVVTIFFLTPFELYFNSRHYWEWDRAIPLNFALGGVLIFLIYVHLVSLARRLSRRFFIGLSLFLFLLGVFVLLADVFVPLKTSVLDGRAVTGSEPLNRSLWEGAIFLGLIIILIIARPRRLVPIGVTFVLILLLISAVYLLLILAVGRPVTGGAGRREDAGPIEGNVYHIVLDEMQTDMAVLKLEGRKVSNLFPGFTLYKFNISNYLFTHESLPSYLTGVFGPEEGFEEWRECFKEEGLFKILYENGYRITTYMPRTFWASRYAAEFKSLDDIYREETRRENAFYKDFAQIWLARITPNVLTNEALLSGKRLGEWIYNVMKSSDAPGKLDKLLRSHGNWIPASINEGKEPFSSVLMLERLIETEKDRAGDGEYVYAHAILPHGPYVMDAKGRFNNSLRRKEVYGYDSQVECAFRLLLKFLYELKRLGRYDSSTIIVQADTGHGHRGFISRQGEELIATADTEEGKKAGVFLENDLNWTKDKVLARTMAFLMIKPAGSRGGLEYSERKSQNIDILPTLVDLLELPGDGLSCDGLSLFSEDFPDDRPATFFLPLPEDGELVRVKMTMEDQTRPRDTRLKITGYRGREYVVEAGSEQLIPLGDGK